MQYLVFDLTDEKDVELLRGLLQGPRYKIILSLISGNKTFKELMEATGLTSNNLSYHLRLLSDLGIVVKNEVSGNIYYSLSPIKTTSLESALHLTFSIVLLAIFASFAFVTKWYLAFIPLPYLAYSVLTYKKISRKVVVVV